MPGALAGEMAGQAPIYLFSRIYRDRGLKLPVGFVIAALDAQKPRQIEMRVVIIRSKLHCSRGAGNSEIMKRLFPQGHAKIAEHVLVRWRYAFSRIGDPLKGGKRGLAIPGTAQIPHGAAETVPEVSLNLLCLPGLFQIGQGLVRKLCRGRPARFDMAKIRGGDGGGENGGLKPERGFKFCRVHAKRRTFWRKCLIKLLNGVKAVAETPDKIPRHLAGTPAPVDIYAKKFRTAHICNLHDSPAMARRLARQAPYA